MIKNILRIIISKSLFWKIRHLIQPNWIKDYDNAEKNISFITNFVKENNLKSFLDFGCASGSTLRKLKRLNISNLVYGVDINKKAAEYCHSSFKSEFKTGFFFSTKLKKDEISKFLNQHNILKFDIVIFDRVLYCLDDEQIFEILDLIGNSSYIFIDDFYKNDQTKNYGYAHRDWSNILNRFSFEIHMNIETIYSKVENANARTMIFKKKVDYLASV